MPAQTPSVKICTCTLNVSMPPVETSRHGRSGPQLLNAMLPPLEMRLGWPRSLLATRRDVCIRKTGVDTSGTKRLLTMLHEQTSKPSDTCGDPWILVMRTQQL